jgi:hypothetical protein
MVKMAEEPKYHRTYVALTPNGWAKDESVVIAAIKARIHGTSDEVKIHEFKSKERGDLDEIYVDEMGTLMRPRNCEERAVFKGTASHEEGDGWDARWGLQLISPTYHIKETFKVDLEDLTGEW